MRRTFVVVLLSAVALATYANALQSPFVWDDDNAIVMNESIRHITTSLVPALETPLSGRPVVSLSFALNYALGGLDTTGYHTVNLAIHVANALLLFGIVRRTLRRRRGDGRSASGDGIALASALIWMVHPLTSEPIDYTTQRTESLMGLFFLLTLYASIRAYESKQPSSRWTWTSILSCAAGMATKESMAVVPIAVVLYDLVFEFDSVAEALAARRALYAGLALTWVELGILLWRWPKSNAGGTAVSSLTYALNQTQLISRYLWLSFWPSSLVVDYGVPQPLHPADVTVQIVVIAALVALTVVALFRWPALGFLGAMFLLTLAPTSSVLPIRTEVGAERRMYLPLAALVVLVVVLVAHALEWFAKKPAGRGRQQPARPNRTIVAVLVVVVAALAVRTVRRNRDYESALTLWKSVVDVKPQGRARFAYANELLTARQYDEATAQLRLAVSDNPDARAGLGTALLLQGQLEEGVEVLQTFVDANPSLPNRIPARALLGQAHQALAERALTQHDIGQAAIEARKATEFDPNSAGAHNALGAALASQGDLTGAIAEFKTAVRLNPTLQSALNNLAHATAMAQGR
jgi:Flp pilus assembly protein TadD